MPGGGLPRVQRTDRHQHPALAQLSARVLGDDERAVEAHVDDGAEILDGHVGDQAEGGKARAVHHDVQRAGVVEKPLHGSLVGDVDGRGGVRVAQFGGPVSCAVGVAVGHRDAAALGGKGARRRPADAGGAADHDGDPLATVAHRCWPFDDD